MMYLLFWPVSKLKRRAYNILSDTKAGPSTILVKSWEPSNNSRLCDASLPYICFSSSLLTLSDVADQVSLGTQTETDRLHEGLQDTVTAYEMQNKFLNKEVLELNQLRQQAIDRY